MIVEVRALPEGKNDIETVFEIANPFDVKITIGSEIYRISEDEMKLYVSTQEQLCVMPRVANAIRIGIARG